MKSISPLRTTCRRFLVGVVCLACTLAAHAEELVYEPYDHPAGSPLAGLGGGLGWDFEWTQDGETGTIHTEGLAYTDTIGATLAVSGNAFDTTGAGTTRNFRYMNRQFNDVWISFLYNLAESDANFEGVTFYRDGAALFSVNNASTTTTASIRMENLTNNTSLSSTKGNFAQTHLIVMKVSTGGAGAGGDRVEFFIDPLLAGNPSRPDHMISAADFTFNRVRIAAQNGSTLLVDELRVGATYADVVPHEPAGEGDSSGDGLTDARKIVLGLDPMQDDSELFAKIREFPDFLGLSSPKFIGGRCAGRSSGGRRSSGRDRGRGHRHARREGCRVP